MAVDEGLTAFARGIRGCLHRAVARLKSGVFGLSAMFSRRETLSRRFVLWLLFFDNFIGWEGIRWWRFFVCGLADLLGCGHWLWDWCELIS
jgi:hypothetical protein